MAEATVLTRRGFDALLRRGGVQAYRLTAACHPRAGVDLIYAGDGRLLVWCHRCHADVAQLALARGGAPPPAACPRRTSHRRRERADALTPPPRARAGVEYARRKGE